MDNENQQIEKQQHSTSINRPAWDIRTSLDVIQKVYEENHLNAFSNEMLAKLLGNSSTTSGSFKRNKASLGYYNLIERISSGSNEGLLKVTDSYFQYITELDSAKKQEFLYSFLYSPTIFQSIKEWFPNLDKLNREAIVMQVMRNKKVDKNIAEEVADNFISSYQYIKSLNSNLPLTHIETIDHMSDEVENTLNDSKEKSLVNEGPVKNNYSALKNEEQVHFNKPSKETTWNLSNGESFSFHLLANIKELSNEDLMEILDATQIVANKINRQIEANKA